MKWSILKTNSKHKHNRIKWTKHQNTTVEKCVVFSFYLSTKRCFSLNVYCVVFSSPFCVHLCHSLRQNLACSVYLFGALLLVSFVFIFPFFCCCVRYVTPMLITSHQICHNSNFQIYFRYSSRSLPIH